MRLGGPYADDSADYDSQRSHRGPSANVMAKAHLNMHNRRVVNSTRCGGKHCATYLFAGSGFLYWPLSSFLSGSDTPRKGDQRFRSCFTDASLLVRIIYRVLAGAVDCTADDVSSLKMKLAVLRTVPSIFAPNCPPIGVFQSGYIPGKRPGPS